MHALRGYLASAHPQVLPHDQNHLVLLPRLERRGYGRRGRRGRGRGGGGTAGEEAEDEGFLKDRAGGRVRRGSRHVGKSGGDLASGEGGREGGREGRVSVHVGTRVCHRIHKA